MPATTNFDVLIVYTQAIATTASARSPENLTPFLAGSPYESYNVVYGYFLETCAKANLRVAFTTSADILGPGLCKSFWTFTDNKWVKNNSPCFSKLIFDKFSPTSSAVKFARQLLFSNPEVKPFNDPYLFNLFFDKQLSYQVLSQYSIPTVSVLQNSKLGLKSAIKNLSRLLVNPKKSTDLSSKYLILKDRFGAGGRHVYKYKTTQLNRMAKILTNFPHVSFILQPLIRFDHGYSFTSLPSSTDIRFIYLKGKIIQCYVRTAKAGDFRCNEHKGGLLTYLDIHKIPKELVTKSNQIAKQLNNKCSLYTLDFVITNHGHTYLIEGNTGPGLDWNMNLKKNEIQAKRLIQLIVCELIVRAKANQKLNTRLSSVLPIIYKTNPIQPVLS